MPCGWTCKKLSLRAGNREWLLLHVPHIVLSVRFPRGKKKLTSIQFRVHCPRSVFQREAWRVLPPPPERTEYDVLSLPAPETDTCRIPLTYSEELDHVGVPAPALPVVKKNIFRVTLFLLCACQSTHIKPHTLSACESHVRVIVGHTRPSHRY